MQLGTPTVVGSLKRLADEPAARPHADIVEFRLDLAESNPLEALEDYDGTLPILATNRVKAEGGAAAVGEERLQTLKEAATRDEVIAVDIELKNLESNRGNTLIDEIRAEASIVASVHVFDTTPSESQCHSFLKRACAAGNVGKLAVMADTYDDALRLLAATRKAANNGLSVGTIAMGQPGQHTRVVAPLYGSRLTYAPVDSGDATAPGQYDLETLSMLLSEL